MDESEDKQQLGQMKSVVMQRSLDIEVVRTVGKRAQTDEKWTQHTKN